MSKFAVVLICLITCSTAFAEHILYVCERPTWGRDEGCGPNKARYTYGFLVDSEDFESVAVPDGSLAGGWEYVYAEARGCDLSRAAREQGKFYITDKGFLFGLGRTGREVELHTDSMNAKLTGSSVKHSPYLTCEEMKGEALSASYKHSFFPRSNNNVRNSPLDPAYTDHTRQ